MKLPGTLLAFIESAFNKIIADQPGIIGDKLPGHCVCMQLDGLDIPIYFRFTDDAVFLFDAYEQQPDTTIQGTPLALLASGLSGEAHTRDLKIDGDLQVAQAFEKLLAKIDIDWEEIVSRYTGDAVAVQLGEFARTFRQWGRQSASAFADDLRDYLQIEARQLPLPAEVDRFNDAVDEVRAAVERFEMRVDRLQSRLDSRQATHS